MNRTLYNIKGVLLNNKHEQHEQLNLNYSSVKTENLW